MHVVATAGHVDHGKSTLVRALTGMEPDPWAEERRRGMTIDLGLIGRALGAAVRAGALLKIAEGVVLLPGADTDAVRVLAALPQPFTVSEARRALGTSRRVAVPLLGHLDRRGLTARGDDARRTLTSPGGT